MLKFDPNKYNEITYQVAQALLWKVTDAILSVLVESKESNLILKVYLDIDKTSILEEKLMADFEIEARERLSDYEIEFLVNKLTSDEFVTALPNSYINEEAFSSYTFLRFNKLWW